MELSVIIPTFNEQNNISHLLSYLLKITSTKTEIIVVDGGSEDKTIEESEKFNVKVITSGKGRAKQLNIGAKAAKNEILYFLHADTIPPVNYEKYIKSKIENFKAGSFRMKFDSCNKILSFYSWFTKFNWQVCRGGDRSLFITKELFFEIGGYSEIPIMEDYEIISRLIKESKFVVLNECVVTSPRKFLKHGVIKLQVIYAIVHFLWLVNIDEHKIAHFLKRNLSK